MDPARRTHAGHDPAGRRSLTARTAAIVVLGLAACTRVLGDLDRIIAVEVVGSTTPVVEEGDTLRLLARAIDARGAVVPDAPLTWQMLDTGQVGFELDPSGLVTALEPDTARVRAVVDDLPSPTVTVIVRPAPDSAAASGQARDTVAAGATASSPRVAIVFDLTTTPGTALPLSGVAVHFAVVDPASGTPAAQDVFLSSGDSVPGADPRHHDAMTDPGGLARVMVHRLGTAVIDSAVVEATVARADGGAVPGSPVRFVVVFLN